jgi:hypothetical protein
MESFLAYARFDKASALLANDPEYIRLQADWQTTSEALRATLGSVGCTVVEMRRRMANGDGLPASIAALEAANRDKYAAWKAYVTGLADQLTLSEEEESAARLEMAQSS